MNVGGGVVKGRRVRARRRGVEDNENKSTTRINRTIRT